MFDGETYDEQRDGTRLRKQLQRVYELMRDGQWRTLDEISYQTGDPQGSVSARLRDLRKEKHGAHDVESRYVRRGLYVYRVLVRSEQMELVV